MSTTLRKSDEFAKEDSSPQALYPDVSIQNANNDIYEDGTIDPVYQAKARLLNSAIQEIGMGRYQVRRPTVERESYLNVPSGISSSSLALAGSRMYATDRIMNTLLKSFSGI